MNYAPLVQLQIRHAYYRGRCPDFEVRPGRAGTRVLANHRLIARPLPDGLLVLAPVQGGAPFIEFSPGTNLELEVRARNPDLALFTDLSPLRAVAAPLYVGGDAGDGPLSLESGPAARPGVFADVELRGVRGEWLEGGPALFTIDLAACALPWIYYLVTDRQGGEFELVDAAPAPAVPLAFTPKSGLDLRAEPDPGDPKGAELAALYPGARLIRFVSTGPVTCAEAPRRHLELRLDGERVPLTLPNPSLSSRTSLEITVDTQSQRHESLFHVVKYLTHSFSPNG